MKNLIYILILLVFVIGCKKKRVGTEIESNVLIELQESQSGEFFINASTSEIYGCSNFPIEYLYTKIGSTITINFKYVLGNGVCLTALGPANANIEMKNLDKENYKIKFKLNGEITRGNLTINPFKLELENNGNVQLK